jgi:hypothetical protein
MLKATNAIIELLRQLEVSDEYAKQENNSPVPSVWHIQNCLLRDRAREVMAALTE